MKSNANSEVLISSLPQGTFFKCDHIPDVIWIKTRKACLGVGIYLDCVVVWSKHNTRPYQVGDIQYSNPGEKCRVVIDW